MKEICDMISVEFVLQTHYAWRNTSTLSLRHCGLNKIAKMLWTIFQNVFSCWLKFQLFLLPRFQSWIHQSWFRWLHSAKKVNGHFLKQGWKKSWYDIDGLMQERRNSIANELHLWHYHKQWKSISVQAFAYHMHLHALRMRTSKSNLCISGTAGSI